MGFKRSRVRIPPARLFRIAGRANLMFHLYVLRSTKTGRRYVGSCENIEDRVRQHNAGHSKATRHGVPLTVLHTDQFRTRTEALGSGSRIRFNPVPLIQSRLLSFWARDQRRFFRNADRRATHPSKGGVSRSRSSSCWEFAASRRSGPAPDFSRRTRCR